MPDKNHPIAWLNRVAARSRQGPLLSVRQPPHPRLVAAALRQPPAWFSRYGSLAIKGLLLLGLYAASLHSYLLFHSLVEIFTIVVGYSIFVVAWNSRPRLDHGYFLLIGIACLYVSSLDLIHTLAYKGMGVFPGYDSDLPTQLWIAARYMQGISLLLALAFLRRNLPAPLVVTAYTLVTVALLAAIFAGVFPICFVEGAGLTPFKKISEYIITLILAGAIVLMRRERDAFDPDVFRWLLVTLLLTIGSELSFTFFTDLYGLFNMVGHFLKLGAFYFIYLAIVEVGLEKPHRLLFRDLQQREEALQNALVDVQRLAITECLTGLYNRRHFAQLAETEMQRAGRYQCPLSILLLDLDHFKDVNDRYGHAMGDQALRLIAECLRQELRAADVPSRYGGDEFVILLPETAAAAAEQIAQRLHASIGRKVLNTNRGAVTVTVSIGVATMNTGDAALDNLLIRADQALYRAKQNGRNQVETGGLGRGATA